MLRERLDAERTTNRLQKDMLKALEDQVRQLKTRLGQTNVEPRLTRQCFDFDEPEPQQTLTKSNVQGLYTTIQGMPFYCQQSFFAHVFKRTIKRNQ